jgi:hypothetical protein
MDASSQHECDEVYHNRPSVVPRASPNPPSKNDLEFPKTFHLLGGTPDRKLHSPLLLSHLLRYWGKEWRRARPPDMLPFRRSLCGGAWPWFSAFQGLCLLGCGHWVLLGPRFTQPHSIFCLNFRSSSNRRGHYRSTLHQWFLSLFVWVVALFECAMDWLWW